MQFDAGLLTVDCVCGVRQGEKLCLRPLNCKYHSVSVKRLVEGRTRPFDDLLAEFNAEQLAARKGGFCVLAARRGGVALCVCHVCV